MKKETRNVLCMLLGIVCVTGFVYLKKGLCGYFPDLMYHMLRIEGVKDAILNGEYPARIYTNFYHGYGYGSPLFYPDIFLVFPAILRILSCSPLLTWKIFALAVTAAGTLSTYFSIKYVCKDAECSVAATFMIMLSQFYLADLHQRVGISEYIAFVFVPILIAGIYDFFACEGKKTYLMGIGFAGLLLSHTIMTFVGLLITITIFVRMLFVKKEKNYLFDKERMVRLAITALFTLLTVSYYLFPMLEQMIALELRYSQPWAHIGKYVQPWKSFFYLIGRYDTIANTGIGLPMFPLILLCVFVRKPKDNWAKAFLFGGIGLYLITTDIVPWKQLENTILNMIQFTYRFWPYAIVFCAIGIAMILSEWLNSSYRRYKNIVLFCIVAVAILAGVFQNRMTAWATSEETKAITEEFLTENDNYSGAGEWLPIKLSETVLDHTAENDVIADNGEKIYFLRDARTGSFYADGKGEKYVVPLIYYKGYRAVLRSGDQKETELPLKQSADALVQVENPTGEAGEICVYYEGTEIQKVSSAVTLGTIVSLTAYYIVRRYRRKFGK